MRVLFLTNIPSPYRVDFFYELGKMCELTVLYEKKAAEDRNKRWISGLDVCNYKEIYLSGIIKGKDNAFCPKVKKFLNTRDYDIIVIGVYSTPTGMYAIRYMKKKMIPYYISCDGGLIREDSKIKYTIKRYFLSGACGYFSSAKMTDEYLLHYGASLEKIHRFAFTSLYKNDILENPFDKEKKQSIRTKLGITEEMIFLSVGQFIYRKGYDLLLKAASFLPCDVGVYIIGDKPTDDFLAMKEQLGLERVHFIDFQEKESLKEYYRSADVFVLPTREDIWGLVINEAMANGLPIITTNKCVAGVELVNENGRIIEANSEENLADVLIEYTRKTTDELEKEAEKSLSIIRNYTIERMAEDYISAWR